MAPMADKRRVRFGSGLKPLALATTAMYVASTALLTASAVFWIPGKNPRWLLATLAGISLVILLFLLRRRNRVTEGEALVLCAHLLGWLGILSWTTHSDLAALANGMLLPMLALYVVWFAEPTRGRVVVYAGSLWWLLSIVQREDAMLTSLSIGIVVQGVAVTELFGRIKRRLDQMASTDMLTGAANRWAVDTAIERAAARLRQRGEPFSVLSIDLDGLREVNNQMGHQAGDELLVRAVEHWTQNLRPTDELARVGGDEFVVVMPRTVRAEAEMVARRLQASAPVAFSVGAAEGRRDDTPESLFGRADRGMYRQKEQRHAPPRVRPSEGVEQVERPTPRLRGGIDEGEVVARDLGERRVAASG